MKAPHRSSESPSPANQKPLPNPPQGAGAHSCCVLGGCVERSPFGEGWGGAYTRGGRPFLLCLRRLCGTPSFGEGWGGAYTRGGSSFLLCFRRLGGAPSPWGGLGWGPCLAGLTLNTIIPASTWTDGNDLWVNYEKCIDAAMLNSISGGCSFQRNECLSTLSKLRCYHHIYKYRIHYHIRHPACISLPSNKCTGQYYTICP